MKVCLFFSLLILGSLNMVKADELKMFGKFSPFKSNRDIISFNVFLKKKSFDYYIDVFVEGDKRSKKRPCRYQIRRITAPQQTRGMKGMLVVYPKKCFINSNNKKINEFWSRVDEFGLYYWFNDKQQLVGSIKIPEIIENKKLIQIDIKG